MSNQDSPHRSAAGGQEEHDLVLVPADGFLTAICAMTSSKKDGETGSLSSRLMFLIWLVLPLLGPGGLAGAGRRMCRS